MDYVRWVKNFQWTPHGRRIRGGTTIIMEEPTGGLHGKNKHGRICGRRQTFFTFGNGQTALSCIDPSNYLVVIIIIIIIINLLLLLLLLLFLLLFKHTKYVYIVLFLLSCRRLFFFSVRVFCFVLFSGILLLGQWAGPLQTSTNHGEIGVHFFRVSSPEEVAFNTHNLSSPFGTIILGQDTSPSTVSGVGCSWDF